MTSITAVDKPQALEDEARDSSRAFSLGRILPLIMLLAGLAPMFTLYFMRIHDMPAVLMNYIPFSSAHFAEDGFIFHRFTPPFYDVWSDYNPTGYTVWYTHYPPLPFYIGGIIWMLGGTTKAALAAFFNVVALAYVLLFYRVFSILLNRWTACVSALILASHPLFIEQVLENYLNLSLFFQIAAFLFLVLALESADRRKRYPLYALCWLCLFGDAFSTFDQILASSFFVFAYTLWRLGFKQWKRVARIVGALATASISAFLLHLLANAWFFGSFSAAFQDLCIDAFQDKSMRDDIPYRNDFSMWAYPSWLAQRVWLRYCMTLGGVVAVGASLSWVLASWRKSVLTRKFFAIAGIMCVANLTYWVVFSRLNYLQFDLTNATQLLPTYSLLLGGAVALMASKAYLFWSRSGFRNFAILLPLALSMSCLYQVFVQTLASAEDMYHKPVSTFTRDISTNATAQIVGDLSDAIPEDSILAITDRAAFRSLMFLTPRPAFGLPELPFSVTYLKASDKNAVYKLESLALSKDVYILRTFYESVSDEQRHEAIVAALIEADVPKDKWEEAIGDLTPIPVRPNWELVKSTENSELYKIHTPDTDDLFPQRASLPTHLAISGARVRDGHELQVVGWVYSPERINRIEIQLDGESLGEAVYPAPGRELAEKTFKGVRQWFGMQDYPLPNEELLDDFPEYEDNTPRFILVRRNLHFTPETHAIGVRAYSGSRLVAEATYALDDVDGTPAIRDYFSVEAPAQES